MAKKPRRQILLRLAVVIVICIFVCTAIWFLATLRQFQLAEVKRSQDDLQRQLVQISGANRDDIYLYDTTGTDELLSTIAGRTDVRRLRLDLTDVGDQGIEHIARIQSLQTLTVYGGRPGLTNDGLRTLGRNTAIVDLKLINTRVSDEGLSNLKYFKSLRSLVLYYNAVDDSPLSEAGFKHLEALNRIPFEY